MKVVTPEQMRQIDELCMLDYYMPGLLLMEHAGTILFNESVKLLKNKFNLSHVHEKCSDNIFFNKPLSVTVVCGKGNNGGDGLVAARHFINSGAEVVVFICAPEFGLSGDSKVNYDILRAMQADIIYLNYNNLDYLEEHTKNTDLIIDALFGTGMKGQVKGYYERVINIINNSGKTVVSADIPSGIDGSSGKICGVAVKADLTVTFGLPKIGNLVYPGREHCGYLVIGDIGFPGKLIDETQTDIFQTEAGILKDIFPVRKLDSNKGTYGRIGVIAGSAGMTGAGILAARAALRTGCGLAYNVVPGNLSGIFDAASVETITVPVKACKDMFTLEGLDAVLEACEKFDSIVLGPGLGMNPETGIFVLEFIKSFDILGGSHNKRLIIDADALNHISNRMNVLYELSAWAVLTPHPGEMARLAGISVAEVQEDRIGIARRISKEYNKTVVLKGAATVTAFPDGTVYINPNGNPAMATAGSGDVLAGIIAALTARNIDVIKAVPGAVFLHGECGDIIRDRLGENGVVAGDLVDAIPEAIRKHVG